MRAGATFRFDESLFVEERKISGLVYSSNVAPDLLCNVPPVDGSQQMASRIATSLRGPEWAGRNGSDGMTAGMGNHGMRTSEHDDHYGHPEDHHSGHPAHSVDRWRMSHYGHLTHSPLTRELSVDNVEYLEDGMATAPPGAQEDAHDAQHVQENDHHDHHHDHVGEQRSYDVARLKEMESRKASLHSSVDNALEGNKRMSQDFYTKLINDTLSEIQNLEKERNARTSKMNECERNAKYGMESKGDSGSLQTQDNGRPKVTRGSHHGELSGGRNGDQNDHPMEPSRQDVTATSMSRDRPEGSLDDTSSLRSPGSIHAHSDSIDGSPVTPQNAYTARYDGYLQKYPSLREIYDLVMASAGYKVPRIAISRRVTTCINAVAGTTRQVDLSFSTISGIINECADYNLRVYAMFRVVQNVLDMCEPGCQIYLNKKSVWPFAHLIRGLLGVDECARVIYFSLLLKRCQYVIPRMFVGEDPETLSRLQEVGNLESDTTYKHIQAFVRLHLSILVVLNDAKLLWSWFAGFINSCWKKVLKAPLAAVLIAALETCAFYLLSTYKKQFEKVLLNCEELLKQELANGKNGPTEMYVGQLRMFFLDFKFV